MSIKSDKWITRKSIEDKMIEPFSKNQVRLDENGEKLISYGVSSYGYDVRCAKEFKVFTNIHSAIVDPKSFDAKSFVDIESDVCVIPPNSFALARTVDRKSKSAGEFSAAPSPAVDSSSVSGVPKLLA